MHVQKVFDFCLNKGNHFQTKKSFFPRDMQFTCVTDTVNVVVTDTCIKSSYFMRRLIILALKFLYYTIPARALLVFIGMFLHFKARAVCERMPTISQI